MKTSTAAITLKTGVLFIALLGLCSVKSMAQINNNMTGDTVTYVLSKDTVSFVSQKTVTFNGKKEIDSVTNVLAAGGMPGIRIVYEKQGQKPKVIKAKDIKALDRTTFLRITAAYNKQTPTSDARPLYVISAK